METGLTLKVYKMDYSFLIKNYLNPNLWKKTWTLFEYKNFKVTLDIYSIQTRNEKICFEIRTHFPQRNGHWTSAEQDIWCSLKIEDITFLKRQINTAIYETFCNIEKNFIQTTEEYDNLMNKKYEEQEKLENIANEFLDNNNITNDNIREAYRDAYVSEYSKMPEHLSDYTSSKIYTVLPDLYLTWLSTLENDPKKEIRTKEIQEKLSANEYEQVMEEVNDYISKMETEEFTEEMKSNLEEV